MNKNHTDTDSELFKRIANGDREAFASFYDRNSAKLYGLAVKLLGDNASAADVLQDVFLQLWKQRQTYSEKRGHPLVWLSIICRNRCIDKLRSRSSAVKKFTALTEATIEQKPVNPIHNPLTEAHLSQMQDAVRDVLRKLPEEQRIVVQMAFERGSTHAEIAAQLGIPLGTAKSRLRAGMIKLRTALIDFKEPN